MCARRRTVARERTQSKTIRALVNDSRADDNVDDEELCESCAPLIFGVRPRPEADGNLCRERKFKRDTRLAHAIQLALGGREGRAKRDKATNGGTLCPTATLINP